MNTYRDKIITYVLTPASWLYGAGVRLRNKLYDSGFFKEYEYDVPVVSVGNLTVGGTGKTPHVEYLVEKLKNKYNIAVISRGYKRKTKGFVIANKFSTPEQIGDEAYQIYKKFGDSIRVAVAEKRHVAIENMLNLFPDINLVILDDAFQHRSVHPAVSILLLDKNRPVDEDNLLPLGRLREPLHGKDRADIVVVTKCPAFMNPLDYSIVGKQLELLSFQKLFFSSIRYDEIKPVFADVPHYISSLSTLTEDDRVLLLTGIAFPRTFVKYFKDYPFRVKVMPFPDHHSFSARDVDKIVEKFEALGGKRRVIVTTEKDAVRLMHNPYIPHKLKSYLYYLPINVHMHYDNEGYDLIEEVELAIEKVNNKKEKP